MQKLLSIVKSLLFNKIEINQVNLNSEITMQTNLMG